MSVRPLDRIYGPPAIKKGENEGGLPRKRPKQKKKEQKNEPEKIRGKIDIKV
jgi:hypothetical protein